MSQHPPTPHEEFDQLGRFGPRLDFRDLAMVNEIRIRSG